MRANDQSGLRSDQVVSLLAPFAICPSQDQISMIREYVRLLLKWNSVVSLTSVLDPLDIVARHFGESMFASTLLPVENGRLADVGTGAGFPGLALKILCQSLGLVLIESNKKKCAFLAEVVRSLGLQGVEIMAKRFEEIRPGPDLSIDFVASRAVGDFPRLLRWSREALGYRGHILLWVGGEDTTKISMTPGWNWEPPARIPESQRRFLLIGRPISQGI